MGPPPAAAALAQVHFGPAGGRLTPPLQAPSFAPSKFRAPSHLTSSRAAAPQAAAADPASAGMVAAASRVGRPPPSAAAPAPVLLSPAGCVPLAFPHFVAPTGSPPQAVPAVALGPPPPSPSEACVRAVPARPRVLLSSRPLLPLPGRAEPSGPSLCQHPPIPFLPPRSSSWRCAPPGGTRHFPSALLFAATSQCQVVAAVRHLQHQRSRRWKPSNTHCLLWPLFGPWDHLRCQTRRCPRSPLSSKLEETLKLS